jgi:hypothetical protein
MKKGLLIFGAICMGLFALYQYDVHSTKKEMEKDIVTYLELQGENKDNIKEIEASLYLFKPFRFVEVVFKDEEHVGYLFQCNRDDNGVSVKYESTSKVDGGLHISEEQELKHQKLRKGGWLDFESKLKSSVLNVYFVEI